MDESIIKRVIFFVSGSSVLQVSADDKDFSAPYNMVRYEIMGTYRGEKGQCGHFQGKKLSDFLILPHCKKIISQIDKYLVSLSSTRMVVQEQFVEPAVLFGLSTR